jgi:hypothetical protein
LPKAADKDHEKPHPGEYVSGRGFNWDRVLFTRPKISKDGLSKHSPVEERRQLEVNVIIILKKHTLRMWIGLNWLRTQRSAGFV